MKCQKKKEWRKERKEKGEKRKRDEQKGECKK